MNNMDHQATHHFDPHALDSAISYISRAQDSLNKDEGREGDKEGGRREGKNKEHSQSNNQMQMSKEEAKIREELEMEIERDLEDEIKDQIYHLALRLHRLYQQQNHNHSGINIDISIQMEGVTKIEINKVKNKKKKKKKKLPNSDHGNSHIEKNHRHCRHSSDYYGNGESKRFDWANTLRSRPPKPTWK